MKQINLERLQDLVLARISAGGTKPPTAKELSTALYPMVKRHWTEAEWRQQFDRVLASLRADRLLAPDAPSAPAREKRPARKGHSKRTKRSPLPARRSAGLALTGAGKARVKSALGLKRAAAPQVSRQFETQYLPRLALGAQAAPGAASVRPSVAVLAQRLGVVPKPASKGKVTAKAKLEAELNGVVDAWLRASLGVSGKKLTLDDLRGALLARELGISVRKLPAVARIAAATLSGASSGDDEAVTAALATRWLFDEPTAGAPNSAPASRPARRAASRTKPGAAPIERIAAKALQAAEGPGARQFGDNKVFIGSVWRALEDDPEIGGLGEAAFKRQLAEAHRQGLLQLGRADLVSAMDPGEVGASEIKHQNATYHFILRGASA